MKRKISKNLQQRRLEFLNPAPACERLHAATFKLRSLPTVTYYLFALCIRRRFGNKTTQKTQVCDSQLDSKNSAEC